MAVNRPQLDELFSHRALDDDEQVKSTKIRLAGQALAEVILEVTPVCGDQQAAIRYVRAAVHWANAAIAAKGIV